MECNRRWATSCDTVLTAGNVLVNVMATSRNQKFFIMVVVNGKLFCWLQVFKTRKWKFSEVVF